MPDATQQLGVDYSATGLRNILKSIDDLTAATSRAEKSFNSMYKAAGTGGRGGTKGLLALTGPVAPNIAVSTNGNGTSRVTTTGNRINIAVMVRVAGGGAGSGQLVPAGSGGGHRIGAYGPRQRRASLVAALTSGNLSGDAYHDTLDAYNRNEKRLKPSTTQSRIMTAIRSTRFNLGESSPLVGRTLDALGVDAEAAAPPLIVAGAAIAAAKALYDLARESSDITNAFTRLTYELGSSPSTAAQVSSIGSTIGLDPSRMASIAQGIQGRITSDPQAMAAGLRLGVYNLPGMYGNQDYGKQALTVIQQLRKIQDPNERLRLARAVGAEDLLPLSNISNGQFRYAMQDAAVTSQINSGSMPQDAADFQAAGNRMADALKNLTAAAGHSEMDRLTSAFNGLASLFNTAAAWADSHKATIDLLTEFAEDLTLGGLSQGVLSMGRYVDSKHSKALDDNTRATEENTRATLQPGTYGREERQGGHPAGVFNGQQFAQSRDMAARKLSTY